MTGKENILKFVIDEFGRRVVITLDFIADYFHFLVNFMLWIDTVEDDIGQKVDCPRRMFFQNSRIIDRIFLVGERVEIATYAFKCIADMPRPAPFCALERHMFTEMCHTFLPWFLVACAHIKFISAVDYIRVRRLMNDTQPIGKRCCAIEFHACKVT